MAKPLPVTIASRFSRATAAELRRVARSLPHAGRTPTMSDALRVLVAEALAARADAARADREVAA